MGRRVNPADDTRRELVRLADELLEQASAVRRQCEEVAEMLAPEEPTRPDSLEDVLERRAG